MLLAFVVGAERIAENAHYISDVIGAFGFGMLSMFVVWRNSARLDQTSRSEQP